MPTIPGDCGCDGDGCDVCEVAHPKPESEKLKSLRRSLWSAGQNQARALESACKATARLSDAEDRVSRIRAQIKEELSK